MTEIIKKILLFDVFPFICRLMAVILLLLALYSLDFPPNKDIGSTSLFFLLSIFFLLLPIAKKISFAKIITFEREIDKVRNEVNEFKEETREFLGVYSNMITAISNTVNQTVNVHLPGEAEAKKAKEELESSLSSKESKLDTIEEEVENYLRQSGGDLNYALARLRMDIERNLREILGKRTNTSDPTAMKGKFMSARQLFKEFTRQYPQYKGMYSSFDYIIKVCNAAIHGQKIFDGHGYEALHMGIKMLKEFENIKQ